MSERDLSYFSEICWGGGGEGGVLKILEHLKNSVKYQMQAGRDGGRKLKADSREIILKNKRN